ncbi:ectoine synthase [Streptomyces sp. NPDC006632]|uniref:ectoine synthase n=1 Tax=Streptomyces sp. NPDC006632 TaxID=3157182 RepID=UPI0033A70007
MSRQLSRRGRYPCRQSGHARYPTTYGSSRVLITPGTMYLLDGHEKHTLRPRVDSTFVCVFNPPVTGREDHDADGVYPLLTEEATA